MLPPATRFQRMPLTAKARLLLGWELVSPLGVLPRIPLPGCMLVVALTGVNQLDLMDVVPQPWCLQRADMKTHAEYVVSYQRPDSIMVSSCGRDNGGFERVLPQGPPAVVCYSLPRQTFWVCLRTQRFGTWAAPQKSCRSP